jgi:hypothetical protein
LAVFDSGQFMHKRHVPHPLASLSWTAKNTVPGSYTLFAILQGTGSGCSVEVAINSRRLTASCLNTGWERVKLGTVELSAPIQTLILRSIGITPVAKVFSLEIVRPEVQVKLAAQAARVAAPTDWMVQAKYGVMVHWTSQRKPEAGKSFGVLSGRTELRRSTVCRWAR